MREPEVQIGNSGLDRPGAVGLEVAMKQASLFSVAGVCMALALLLQCEGLWAQGARDTEQPKKVVARYIQAIQQADLKTIIDLQSNTPGQIAAIKASNPQALWAHLIGQYYDEKISSLSKDISSRGNYFQAFLPPSCKWSISEVRADADTAEVYVTVDYPLASDAPIAQQFDRGPIRGSAKLLKHTILKFLVYTRSQLIGDLSGAVEYVFFGRSTFVRFEQADVYWETHPFRILNASWEQGSGVFLNIDVIGGSPPFNSTTKCGSLKPKMHEDANISIMWYGIEDEHFPLRCSVKVTERLGQSDEVAFTVPQTPRGQLFISTYCWVRNPWRLRGQGIPNGCSVPIREFESIQSTPPSTSAESGTANPPAATTQPIQPAISPPVAPQPSAPVASNCSNYDACIQSGMSALNSGLWSQSLADFLKASNLAPSKPAAWSWLGTNYLLLSREQEAPPMWDKALQAGEISFVVYRERSLWSDRGSLRLTPTEVSFIDQKGQKVFAVLPSDTSSSNVLARSPSAGISSQWLQEHRLTLDPIPYVGLRIAGKNYNFEFFPLQAGCEIQASFVLCPEPGRQQQSVIANYVVGTISKLASGSFAKTVQPPTPKIGCDTATDLGYSLLAGGHLYKVKGIASPSGGQVLVFFDEKGSPVQDQNLLQKLALGAWTRENIVASTATRAEINNKAQILKDMIGTSQALQHYDMAQDALARAMAAAIEAGVTGGASINTSLNNLALNFVQGQFSKVNTARTVLTLTAQASLQTSVDKYSSLNSQLPPADSLALAVSDLQKFKDLYTQAQGLDLPGEALIVSLMPTSAHELTDAALQSVLDQLVKSLPGGQQAATLKNLLDLEQDFASLSKDLPALKPYYENLNLVLRLAQANDRKIASWADQAGAACASGVGAH
jgi:tetratricopeptide (TPR) repeat protein